MVADMEELENLDASQIHPRRVIATEVPVADGTAKLFGRDHEFRAPTLRREQPVRSEDLRAEARNDFWSI